MAGDRDGALVTLLTDLGITDTYVGVMKAVILSICPQARIVDLCHDISPQDIQQAAFLLGTAWGYCPEGTVHVIVVDPGVGSERRVLAVDAHRQCFIASDNGVLTYILAEAREYRAYSVERSEHFLPNVSQTFHGRDVMAPVAGAVARGLALEELGPEITGPVTRFPVSKPVMNESGLVGHVVHVDRFGNLVTDLTETDVLTWQREVGADAFVIRVGDSVIEEIRMAYAGADPGELLAIYGSSGRIEVSLNLGNAADCLGVGTGAIVLLEARA